MQHTLLPISSQKGVGHRRRFPDTLRGVRLLTLGTASILALGVAGCGSVASAPDEPAAKAVELKASQAKFSKQKQITGDDVTLSLTVTNTGENPVPEVVVLLEGLGETTITNPTDEGRERTEKDDLPDSTKRAAWFVDEAPGGGSYGESSLYPGGRLEPGRSRTLRWRMSASTPGSHTLKYQVFGGLTDNQAKKTTGTGLTGSVSATIADSETASNASE